MKRSAFRVGLAVAFSRPWRFAVLVVVCATAAGCGDERWGVPNDAALDDTLRDASMPDRDASATDATADFSQPGVDASPETAADSDPVGDGGDSSLADTRDANRDADSSVIDTGDAGADAEEADAGCVCAPVDGGINPHKRISLDCFCKTQCPATDCFPQHCSTYEDILRDPCNGLRAGGQYRGEVWLRTYDDVQLISLSRSAIDGALTTLVFDATTKTLVGASRTWFGVPYMSAFLCDEKLDAYPSLLYFTVSAGIATTGTPSSLRALCPPPDGGLDASPDMADSDARGDRGDGQDDALSDIGGENE